MFNLVQFISGTQSIFEKVKKKMVFDIVKITIIVTFFKYTIVTSINHFIVSNEIKITFWDTI